MDTSVRVISSTPDAEGIMGYCARVSSPKNQKKMDEGKLTAVELLKYCARSGHWSVFEMANVVMEINTTRAISAQILRHRSFSFQEFSQRYSAVDTNDFVLPEMRRKGTKNRQSSCEVISDEEVNLVVDEALLQSCAAYESLLAKGVATETARMVLPMCSPTKLYMNGTVRSWIHYLGARCKPEVQKEHRLIAEAIRSELAQLLPVCAEAFLWI